ncbi:MAG: 30S ribosomal protein S8 [Deltaproteobacteria bacterium]|jgi:small subunit ribosomal protein S8|nr:30S ribosomal protein S8 [Deltaproteobacteria bacterium]
MNTDPIADLLTRIRNAQKAGHQIVYVPFSKTKESIISVLLSEGYIEAVTTETKGIKKNFRIVLKYTKTGRAVIKEIKRLSSSGRRLYVPVDKIPVFRSGLGTIIVSTSKGMMTGREAKRQNIGGELVCSIF